jgi:hypothetical protein
MSTSRHLVTALVAAIDVPAAITARRPMEQDPPSGHGGTALVAHARVRRMIRGALAKGVTPSSCLYMHQDLLCPVTRSGRNRQAVEVALLLMSHRSAISRILFGSPIAVVLTAAASSCGSRPMAVAQACSTNGDCTRPLVCTLGHCGPGEAGGVDDGGIVGAGNAANVEVAVSVDQACADVARGACDLQGSCWPAGTTVEFGDATECRASIALWCNSMASLNGSGATPDALERCALELTSATCKDFVENVTAKACRFTGSLV